MPRQLHLAARPDIQHLASRVSQSQFFKCASPITPRHLRLDNYASTIASRQLRLDTNGDKYVSKFRSRQCFLSLETRHVRLDFLTSLMRLKNCLSPNMFRQIRLAEYVSPITPRQLRLKNYVSPVATRHQRCAIKVAPICFELFSRCCASTLASSPLNLRNVLSSNKHLANSASIITSRQLRLDNYVSTITSRHRRRHRRLEVDVPPICSAL